MATSPQLQDHPRSKSWRCGVCLFVLPSDLSITPGDHPPNINVTFSQSSGEVYKTYLSSFWQSVSRGCDVCMAIASVAGLSQDKHRDTETLKWGHGHLIISSAMDTEYRIFVEQEDETAATFDPRDIHPSLNLGTSPSGDTSSAAAFDMLKVRMRNCLDNHKECATPVKPGTMPKRLLYIEDSISAVRLIDDTSNMAPQPYVCLSHRWAEQTELSSLTVDRLTTFKHQIPKDLLYPLLRDAFIATERLGFRYIWIDCLCICQDDLDDWNEQAAEMSAIYENAVVTISALDAQLNDWRLFCKGPPEKIQKLCSRGGQTIMIAEMNISHPFSIDTVGPKFRASSESQKFPLLRRGWVYQERLLARRIAYFTQSEVIWECREAMSCECGHHEAAWALTKSQSPKLSDMIWSDICEEYTKTELSIDADRLPALSGVARRFGEAHGWTYLAGIWREDPKMRNMLLWFATESHTRQYTPGVPSWSWASARAVRFHPLFQSWGLQLRVVDHDLVPGAIPYSTPRSLRLVVEVPCTPVTVKFNPGSSENAVMTLSGDDTLHDCFMDYLLDENTKQKIEQSNDIIFLLCLQDDDGPGGLLVKPISLRENTYERIAFFSRRVSFERNVWETKRVTLV